MLADRFQARAPVVRDHDVMAEPPDDFSDDPLVIEVVLGYDDECHSRRINQTKRPAAGFRVA
ncbi:hypothetical protein Ato02nite_003980 [Paractinoplanes toevensis]|uniref:Uncharacterized protein n=1 Tax=Paractinoplanes toevensis TaxID=571911 RepID=A0A919T3Y3_9ACTN|nr:hypothetical protein Ato02nite_003980 [Actinoplanes toevensis]